MTSQQLSDCISLSKSAIYRRMDARDKLYDPSFPRPIKLGATTGRWIASEVNDWIMNTIKAQRQQKF
ncbi:MAG: AlpA family phage regulatory protein [Thiomicrospira sp.]|nr:AlpA family phage regulatory protein [Thiomicrospira sp.]